MKKVIAMLTALVLLTGVALCGGAEAEWTICVCEEENFTVRIPANKSTEYDGALMIYVDEPGVIPYVMVHRRAMDKKFSDPQNYLNNVYREHMEDKYGNDSRGMNPAKTMEIGGKELLGARYMYMVGEYQVVLLKLIEIRPEGDVEFSAKYIDGEDEAVMAALDEAIRSYVETDTAEVVVEEPKQESGKVLEPMDLSWLTVNKEDGRYNVNITDTEMIDNGGCFTAEIYFADTYPIEEVYALQEGDKIMVNGTVWTVDELRPEQDDARELRVKEDMDGYIVFKKATENYLTVQMNDWTPCTLIGKETIMLPLPNAFMFVWMSGDEEVQTYDWESFVSLLRSGELAGKLNQYNTLIQFSDGMVQSIGHTDYPEGPVQQETGGWAGE